MIRLPDFESDEVRLFFHNHKLRFFSEDGINNLLEEYKREKEEMEEMFWEK